MIRGLIQRYREYKKRSWLESLGKNGMRLGKNVQIEGDVFIDPSHCFLIAIEDDCVFAPGVRIIAHDASLFRNIGITRIGKVTVKRNTFLGDSVIVLPGVTIGPDCIVGSGSVVTKSIPANSVAAGNPAKVLCALDSFLEKHRSLAKAARIFHESEYNRNVLTPEKRKEMLEYLDSHVGYMAGDNEDRYVLNRS